MNVKNHILSNARDLMMLYGIRSVSMDAIAGKCGISKKTIYLHFENKSSLVEHLVDTHIKEDIEKTKAIHIDSRNAIDEIITLAQGVITFMKEMRPILIHDLQKYYPKLWEGIEQNHMKFVEKNICANILRGKKEGLYMPEVNETICARIYVQNSLLINNSHVFPEGEFDKPELFKAIILNYIRGIISIEGRDMLDKIKIN